MKNSTMIMIVIAIVIAGAAGFFGGMQWQKSQRGNFAQFAGNGQGRNGNANGQGRFGNGMRPVVGEIISADDKSITVKLMDGSSKIVILSSQTLVNKAATGSITDLKTGERVSAFGTTNADGSMTAQSVQLNPMFRGSMGSPTPTK